MSDLIDRQAAIDAVNCVMVMKGIRSGKSIVAEAVESAKRIITDNIRQLPPAQPQQLEQCPIYGGMCAYPSDRCYDCPRHAGAKMEVTT